MREGAHAASSCINSQQKPIHIVHIDTPCSLCSLTAPAADEASLMYYLYNYGFTATKQISDENPWGPGKKNFGREFHFLFL